LIGVPSDVALPVAQHYPALPAQFARNQPVSLSVAFDFGDPISGVRALKQLFSSSPPVASMPKIAITEYCNPSLSEDEVRTPWQINSVRREMNPGAAQCAAQQQFGFRRATTIGAHAARVHF
jgi:hypothetical protein